jgi:putative FmdB family regulatory protein
MLLPPGGTLLPLYEFECNSCGQRFERIQKFSASAPDCPECGKKTRRLLSAPAIRFKGAGWYVTDYAKKAKPKETGEGTTKATPAKKDSDGKKSGDSAKGTGKSKP